MTMQKIERPDIVDYEMLEYLDALKENEPVDYFPLLKRKFRLTNEDTIEVLKYWQRSYSERHPNK